VSAPDFAARALAIRAGALNAVPFTQLSQASLPASLNQVFSSGHTSNGIGAATYVCDSKATSALQVNHPLAVFGGPDGRFFRISGDNDGFVTPEQFGCPPYAPGINAQPMIQAALNYCKAVGLKGVKFPERQYELWPTPRTAGFGVSTDHSGDYLTVDQWACSLLSTNPRGTLFQCRGVTGGDPLTDYTIINTPSYGGDVIWRGSAIKLTGSVVPWAINPGEDSLSHLTMKGILWKTGITAALSTDWPCLPPSRTSGRENAWDISMKGVYCQQDRIVGNITIIDGGFDGFLGENIYCGGGVNVNQRVILRNYTARNTNGTGVNPNGPRSTDIDGAFFENCVAPFEGWMGWEWSRVVNALARNCKNGGDLKGSYSYDMPLRPDGGEPTCTVDMTYDRCGTIYVGSYVKGRLHLIDTQLHVSTVVIPSNYATTARIRGIDLAVASVANTTYVDPAIRFAGTATAAQMVSDNTIRLSLGRTKEAIAAGFRHGSVINVVNSLGPRNTLYVRGYCKEILPISQVPADNHVVVIDEGLERNLSGGTFGSMFDPSTTPSPNFGSSWLYGATFSGGSGVWPVDLPATTMFQEGHQITLEHRDSTKLIHFIEVREGGEPRAVLGYKDLVRFRCNKSLSRWEMVLAPAKRKATVLIDIASTAAGAESGPYVIQAPGCRPTYRAEVLPVTALTGLTISALRAETDAVKFWVRNIDGGATLDPPATNFTALWSAP
jgi:hypothetical protein